MLTRSGGEPAGCARLNGALRSIVAAALFTATWSGGDALAQKQGGTLRVYQRDSPADLSILEQGTISVVLPMMGVFNNLVAFDPDTRQNGLDSIVPDLAESWRWSENGKDLTVKLREGVKWHDGRKFTARDVKCTWDLLLGRAQDKLRLNVREKWWINLNETTADNDYQATFHLKRPQPAFLALLASGFSPVYPCHVAPGRMRRQPIGTGPFKFVEFKPNQSIRVARNPDYWKKDRPYLDGVEYTIVPSRSAAMLAFIAGNFDMTFPYEVTIPMVKDVQSQMPQATCEIAPLNVALNILIARRPPFDNAELRQAIAMTLERKVYVDMLGEGHGDVGAAMLPAPEGLWAMPREMLSRLPGYNPDIQQSRDAARRIMRKLGYSPERHLSARILAPNLPIYRDPAAVAADQLKQIWVDAEIEPVETANWLSRLVRGDFTMALSLAGNALDDPDRIFSDNYRCDAARNYTRYCNRELDKAIDRQSMERDPEKRRQQVWEIDRKLQADAVRPILYHLRQGTCWRPEVKGVKLMVNSIYNGWRMEDIWLDR